MGTIKVINGNTEASIWQQIDSDFTGAEVLEYSAMLQQSGKPSILLEMEIDPGGGFEGGYEMTRFSAPVAVGNEFRFALHHESFLDKAGKLFGLEDKVIGYPDFDDALVVKTNDEATVKQLFEAASVRELFQSLEDFNLHITHTDAGTRLELELEQGITDTATLKELYDAFTMVLMQLDNGQSKEKTI